MSKLIKLLRRNKNNKSYQNKDYDEEKSALNTLSNVILNKRKSSLNKKRLSLNEIAQQQIDFDETKDLFKVI
jgi:hypothetical protein